MSVPPPHSIGQSIFGRPNGNSRSDVLALPDPDLDHGCANPYVDAYPGLIACKILGLSSLKGWQAIDELRRRKRVATETQDVEELPDRETGGQHAFAREALAQLSPGDRELLYLFDIDGFDAREIGEMLGISRNAVHVRVFRARERFRKIYRPIGETP